ncbi:MAG: response regulator [Pseudobdellovibrionaceae bacterium]
MNNLKTKILIVEDDGTLLKTLSDFFSEDFDEVVCADDGISAFLAINESPQKPDLIFTDIKMPGWDGLQFITQLRGQGINIPVLFSSGTAEKEDIIKALRLGSVDFVEKPYNLEDIRVAIHRVLEISRRESELGGLIEKFGDASAEVARQKRLIGLFRVANTRR